MNKFAQILSLALAISGASSGIASASVTVANVCTASVRCVVQQTLNPNSGAPVKSPTPANTSRLAVEAPAVMAPITGPVTGPVPSFAAIVEGELNSLDSLVNRLRGLLQFEVPQN